MLLNKRQKKLGKSLSQLTGIDIALAAQRVEVRPLSASKNIDITFGIYRRQDGQLVMGNKVEQLTGNKGILTVDDTEYKLTPGLEVLIVQKHSQPTQYNSNDYRVYKSLCAQRLIIPESGRCYLTTHYMEI